MPKNWSYPYFLVLDNFIPLSLVVLGAIVLELLIYSVYISFQTNSLESIELKKMSCINMVMQVTWIIFIFAFAQIDEQFVLYKIIKECTAVLRQLDVFVYASMFLLILRAMQYKNTHTYINTLTKYMIVINQIEIIAIIFQKFSKGEKGYLSLQMQVLLAFLCLLLNTLLLVTQFVGKESVVIQEEINLKESRLYDLRKPQLYEIMEKIRAYTKKEQLTIFISDEWGGGKTFFAKKLCSELEQLDYITVWIDLLDFNEKESFITQVLRRIRNELELHNYYTGKASEFEEYLKAILSVSLDEAAMELMSKKFHWKDGKDEEISRSLVDVTESLAKMLGSQKMVILIDDMDRCTEETVKYAMKLFSEIMLLPKSIVVFVGDYRQLLQRYNLNKGFFDKYFTYNYNLCTIPYDELLEYYRDVYSFDELKLQSAIRVPEYVKEILDKINEFCSQEESASVLYKEELMHGPFRDAAIDEEILLVQNLTIGLKKIREKLSNPRKVIRIYKEIFDQLKRIRMAIDAGGSNYANIVSRLNNTVYPAIMFYSLARTICTDHFWELSVDDFSGFKDDILGTLHMMGSQNLLDEKIEDEQIIYGSLVYYFFSTNVWGKNMRAEEFEEFYVAPSVKKYLFG